MRRDVTGEAHSLGAELTRGPALCGLAQPPRDWVFAGFTIHPDQRVDCDRCREVALTMRTAWTTKLPFLGPFPP